MAEMNVTDISKVLPLASPVSRMEISPTVEINTSGEDALLLTCATAMTLFIGRTLFPSVATVDHADTSLLVVIMISRKTILPNLTTLVKELSKDSPSTDPAINPFSYLVRDTESHLHRRRV